mgnify:FL=1
MIIGKIMMIQNSSSKESVEYLISKKIMELKGNIKDYTLNRFIEEVGVSKTSMVRYLKILILISFLILKMLCTKNICMRK